MRHLGWAALAAVLLVAGCKTPSQAPPRPVGRVLACMMKIDGDWGLWLIYLDSGEQKRINLRDNCGPDWSPDGHQVVYTDGERIRIMRSDGFNDRALAGGPGWAPAWAPDGREIAYGTLNSIQSRTEDGSETRVWSIADVVHEHPTWSPDGKRLAMTDTAGNLVITDGTTEKKIPLNGGRHPEWSPDGKLILLDAQDDVIRALDLESGEIRPVGNARGQDPSWLKDGSFLTTWKGSGDGVACVYQWDPAGVTGRALTSRDEVRDASGNW